MTRVAGSRVTLRAYHDDEAPILMSAWADAPWFAPKGTSPRELAERVHERIRRSGSFTDGVVIFAIESEGRLVGEVQARQPINGLPHGNWGIRVSSPGFISFSKPDGGVGHALQQDRTDIRLTLAAPGGMTGTVRDPDGNPIAAAHVLATLQAGPLFRGQTEFRAQSAADGTYSLQGLTPGDYTVVIENDPANPIYLQTVRGKGYILYAE